MKINCCDVCLIEKKMTVAGYTFKIQAKFQTVKADVCEAHKGTLKGKTSQELLDLCAEAETNRNQMMFPKGA